MSEGHHHHHHGLFHHKSEDEDAPPPQTDDGYGDSQPSYGQSGYSAQPKYPDQPDSTGQSDYGQSDYGQNDYNQTGGYSTKPDYNSGGYGGGYQQQETAVETTDVYGETTVDEDGIERARKEEKHSKHEQHMGELGALAAGGFALYERHEAKKDPEHGGKHKIIEGIAAAAAVGSGGYAFHEHHNRKEAQEDEEQAEEAEEGGQKKHHFF